MGAWQDGEVATNGITLHYTRTGGDKPPLVLAHGFSDDGRCWTPVAEALEADYDIVMVDARGHGRSAAPASGYGSREMADDLAGAIAALGLRRPAILGHSMGAALTLVLAGIYPRPRRDPAGGPAGPLDAAPGRVGIQRRVAGAAACPDEWLQGQDPR